MFGVWLWAGICAYILSAATVNGEIEKGDINERIGISGFPLRTS